MDFNPFLDNDDEEELQHQAALPPPVNPPPPNLAQQNQQQISFKLQPFWVDAPDSWFAAAEVQFRLRRIVAQEDRFCLVVAALDKETLKKVVHLVTAADLENPYEELKTALLLSHQLTDFQRVELLLAMEPLGGRKPSALLADMLELCPAGQHNNIFFVGLFLQRLPRELRVLLTHEDHTDLRCLAAHADRLVAFNGKQPHDVAAAVPEPAEAEVAAVKSGGQHRPFNKQRPPPVPPRTGAKQADGGAGAAGGSSGKGGQSSAPTPANLARKGSGLCWNHWKFGENAHRCSQPCSWAGN